MFVARTQFLRKPFMILWFVSTVKCKWSFSHTRNSDFFQPTSRVLRGTETSITRQWVAGTKDTRRAAEEYFHLIEKWGDDIGFWKILKITLIYIKTREARWLAPWRTLSFIKINIQAWYECIKLRERVAQLCSVGCIISETTPCEKVWKGKILKKHEVKPRLISTNEMKEAEKLFEVIMRKIGNIRSNPPNY